MKQLLLIILSIIAVKTEAQSLQTCGIYYDYDQAGNRIKRYYACNTVVRNMRTANPGNDSIQSELYKGYDVKVFPNPVKDFFTIKLPGVKGSSHFHLYDTKGSIIVGKDITAEETQYNIVALATGTYHLSIKYNEKLYYFELLKIE